MLTKHHRKLKSLGGSDEDRNIAMVKDKKHKAWHIVFSNKTTEQIVWELNNVWLDPDYEITLKKRRTK